MENKLNLDISQTDSVTCDECGGMYFQQALHIRKASGFLTGTGQTSYIPIPLFACISCGHVNTEFLPKEVPNFRD